MWPKRIASPGFHLRPLTVEDVEKFPDLYHAEGVDPQWFPDAEFSREVLARCSGFGITLVRTPRAHEPALTVGFGMSAFVRNSCIDRALEVGRREEASRFAATLGPGDLLDGLTEADSENAGPGVNILVYGNRADSLLRPGTHQECTALYTKGFLEVHLGYNIQQFLFIAANPVHRDYLLHSGGALQGPGDAPPPWLIQVSGYQARIDRGTIFAMLFLSARPVICLSPIQRELVLLALEGKPDDEIAEAAGISFGGVKKRWESVFERAGEKVPGLLPAPSEDGRRGPERRAALLDYLRHHPEELRP